MWRRRILGGKPNSRAWRTSRRLHLARCRSGIDWAGAGHREWHAASVMEVCGTCRQHLSPLHTAPTTSFHLASASPLSLSLSSASFFVFSFSRPFHITGSLCAAFRPFTTNRSAESAMFAVFYSFFPIFIPTKPVTYDSILRRISHLILADQTPP